MLHAKGISEWESIQLFIVWTAGPHKQRGCAAEWKEDLAYVPGVRNGGSLVLWHCHSPCFFLGLRKRKETFQLKAFKV